MSGPEALVLIIKIVIYGTGSIFCPYLFFDTFLMQKKKMNTIQLLLFLAVLGVIQNHLLEFIEATVPWLSFIRPVLAVVVHFVFYGILLLLFRKDFKKKLLVLFCYPVVAILGESIGTLLVVLIQKQNITSILADPVMYEQMILISAVLVFAIVILLRHFVRSHNLAMRIRRIYLSQMIVPFLSIITICFILQFADVNILLYIAGLLLIINIAIIMVYGKLGDYYEQNQEYALRQQHESFREEHYRELEAHQAEIRSMKHDLKNQLIAMDAYVKTGAADRAGEQLGALIEQLSESDRLIFTEHVGANGLLSATYRQAEKDGILCDFKADLPEELGMADGDLVAMLGNILDNALESCRLCSGKPYIRLEIAERNHALLLRCENSTDGKVSSLETRKEDTEHHGIGMKSIQQTVRKYGGDLHHEFAAHHFMMELSLFLSAPDHSRGE